jgi:hypothetical protein
MLTFTYERASLIFFAAWLWNALVDSLHRIGATP